nr:DUF2812 domain-containing protein [Sedimentibacter sp.]
MDDIKKVNWGFSKLEYKIMEQYLAEMAIKGWMLDEINKKKVIFTQTNPRKLKFCVDIAPKSKKSLLNDEGNNDIIENYKKNCERLGWHFITSYDQVHIFYAENYENTYRIHTDIESEKELLINTIWKKEIFNSLLFVIFLTLATVFIYKYKALHNNLILDNWIIFLFIPVAYFAAVVSATNKFVWYFKIKSKVNYHIDHKYLKFAKIRNAISDFIVYLFQVYSIFILVMGFFPRGILDNLNTKLSVLAILLFVVCSCYIYMKIRDVLNKKWEILFISGIFIGITILVYIMARISLYEYNDNPKSIQIVPEQYSIIRISDFIDTKEIDNNEFTRNYSPLVPVNYEYYEYYSNNNDTYITETDYYKCLNEYIASIIYDGIIYEYEKKTYINNKVTSTSSEYWNCDKATLINDDTLLLLNDSEVIKIRVSEKLINIYADKFREKLFEKFMIDN